MANPPSVSGPGRLSRRTDRQPIRDVTGGDYGDNKEMRGLQKSAPMSASAQPNVQANPTPLPQAAGPEVVPLDAPSQRPNEPVTAGSPLGPGPGPSIRPVEDNLAGLRKNLQLLTWQANRPGASPALRNLVRYLKGTA
jgi:hypothetical protein